MAKKTKTATPVTTLTPSDLEAALQTEAGQKVLVAAVDKMFTEGKWEIPDDAVTGKVSAKVAGLEAQVKSLTNLLSQLSAEVRQSSRNPGGERADSVANEANPTIPLVDRLKRLRAA